MAQADVDDGDRDGLSTDERKELVELRRKNRVLETEVEILKHASAYFRPGEHPPKMMFRLVHELAADGFAVTVTCKVLKVSTSGSHEWRRRSPSARDVADADLIIVLRDIHASSRQTYGVRRCRAELRLGIHQRSVAHKRVARPHGCVTTETRLGARSWTPADSR